LQLQYLFGNVLRSFANLIKYEGVSLPRLQDKKIAIQIAYIMNKPEVTILVMIILLSNKEYLVDQSNKL
jgi:hypothetical protein